MNQETGDAAGKTETARNSSFYGMYSSSGLDVLKILSKVQRTIKLTQVVHRQNPVVNLGPVDLSASFIIVDAKKYDLPIVYASQSFERLTGYTTAEILGKNCRFLQSPDGLVQKGAPRLYSDNNVIFKLKESIEKYKECQYMNVNFKKSGEPFVNLITVVPIRDDEDKEIIYFIGFQVDVLRYLVFYFLTTSQTSGILKKMEDGSYVVSFNDGLTQLKNMRYQQPQDYGHVLDSLIVKQQDDLRRRAETTGAEQSNGNSKENSAVTIDDTFVTQMDMGATATDPSKQTLGLLDHTVTAESLLKSYPDNLQIISLRGLILYSSYDPDQVGTNINDMTHPSDMIQLQREMKSCNINDSFTLTLRIKASTSDQLEWFTLTGRKYEMLNRKRTKCFIFIYRRKAMDILPKINHVADGDVWGKCSETGIILYAANHENLYGQLLPRVCNTQLGHLFANKSQGNFCVVYQDQQAVLRLTPLLSGLFLFHISFDMTLFTKEISDVLQTNDAVSYLYEANRIKMMNKKIKEALSEFGCVV